MFRAAPWILLAALSTSAVASDDADGVLARSRETYAAIRTYQDDGFVEEGIGWDVSFTSSFSRPDRLRVQWVDRDFYYFGKMIETLRADGQQIHVLKDYHGQKSDEVFQTLSDGVAASTGISHAVSHHIVLLLIPDLWGEKESFGRSVLALESAQRRGVEKIDDVDCDHVAGRSGRTGVDVWIGVADHLVRRIDTSYGEYKTSEHHRHIRIDAPVFADGSVATSGG